MKVKKITQIIPKVGILAVGLLVATSCNDITELQPADAFSESTAFSSAQRVELAIIGMYNAAQSGTYAGGAVRGYPFGSASIEQGDMRGEDMLNQALFYQITYESSITPFSANNVWMWNTLYTLINQCNVVIEGVKAAAAAKIITDAQAVAYEGECRFMRALAYHELLVNFARPFAEKSGAELGVPIRDFAINSPSSVDKAIAQPRNFSDTILQMQEAYKGDQLRQQAQKLAQAMQQHSDQPLHTTTQHQNNAVAVSPKMADYLELEKLFELHQKGILSEEEYAEQKRRILNNR